MTGMVTVLSVISLRCFLLLKVLARLVGFVGPPMLDESTFTSSSNSAGYSSSRVPADDFYITVSLGLN